MLELKKILRDRYKLQEILGQNVGRQTWLAEDLIDRELVVAKLLTFGGDVQWEDLKLFEREAQVLKQIEHEFIPKYRDYFPIDESSLWFCLIQEYIPSKSLRELLKEGKKFTELEVKQVVLKRKG
jgi:serine/threonine protein kinase